MTQKQPKQQPEQQLSLDVQIKQDASLSDFSSPSWASIIDVVRQLHAGLLRQLYLHGERDTGKTHLLSAICDSFRDAGKPVIYLSLRDLVDSDPSVLSALESMEVIALDDIDVIERSAQWQEAVFHLINLSSEFNNVLIFASRVPVAGLDFGLKDLLSRLAKSPTFQLPLGNDRRDREEILQSVLKRRNWQFDPRIIEHLLKEGPHRIGAMLGVLTELQPLFSNLERAHVTKAKIQQAIDIIDNQTLMYELQDLDTPVDNLATQNDFLDF